MMKTLFSISFVLASIIAILAVWESAPSLQQLNLCYQETRREANDDGYKSKAYGWSQRQICETEQGSILNLGACLNKITQNEVAKVVNPIIWNVEKSIIPGTKNVDQYRQDHNASCADYPTTLF